MKSIDVRPELTPSTHFREKVGELTLTSPRHQIDQRIHRIMQVRREFGFLNPLEADERVYLRSLARRQQRLTIKAKQEGGV